MKILSRIWLESSFLFDFVQSFFNGEFWRVFEKRFAKFGENSVVDLACGTGTLLKYINPKEYLGIDLNRYYIRYARKRFKRQGVRFIVGDVLKFAKKESLDTVFLISVVHHLD